MSPDLHHLSGAYAVDALDDAERASFEQHLAVCADCRAEVAELSATAHSLGALTEATPPASLRDSVLSGIARVRPLPPLHEDAGEPAPVVTAPAAGPATATDDALAGTGGGTASGRGPGPTESADETGGRHERRADPSTPPHRLVRRGRGSRRDRDRRCRLEPVVRRLEQHLADGPGGRGVRRDAGDQQPRVG